MRVRGERMEKTEAGALSGAGGFVSLFDGAASERLSCRRGPPPPEHELVCVEWVHARAAGGESIDSTERAWLGTWGDASGEPMDVAMPVSALAYAVALNLPRTAVALLCAGADPAWSLAVSSAGCGQEIVSVLDFARGWSNDLSWRGTCCQGLVEAALEVKELRRASEGGARLLRPARKPRL